ncbi:MAG: LD-carboxypeptidase [Desulforhopalus sp.]|nr:LD-carboxypeptidase [Desulforhopalus sp.]
MSFSTLPAPLFPLPLKRGDTLGIIAPAGQLWDPAGFERGIARLREMGFEVKFPRELWPGSEFPWFSDTDANRAEEFNRMWADPEVQGILCMRGGFGCLKLLEKIDYEQIRTAPKVFAGFSDISILLNVLRAKTGLVSLHAPVVTSIAGAVPATLERLARCLQSPLQQQPALEISQLEVLRDGAEVRAPLLGGNLTTLVSLLGTPNDIDYSGCLLLLEDVGEPLYKIDRMLTQMQLAGKLKNLAGLLLGDFHTSQENAQTDRLAHLRFLEAVWKLALDAVSCPVWAGLPVGHCPENMALVIGAQTLMSKKKDLRFT